MMKNNYIAPRTEQEILTYTIHLLGGSGDVGLSQTPANPSYPGGGD